MVYAPPTGSLLTTVLQDPDFMSAVANEALKANGLPISPAIKDRLTNITLDNNQAGQAPGKITFTLAIKALHDQIVQVTDADLTASGMPAKAELFPVLTPGSKQFNPAEQDDTAAPTTLSGLSEGGGDDQSGSQGSTAPATSESTVAPADSSGVTSRPDQQAPGSFSMFAGQPQDRDQAEQAFAAEQLAKQLAEQGKSPKPQDNQAASQPGQPRRRRPRPSPQVAGQQDASNDDQGEVPPEDEMAVAGQLRQQQQQTPGLSHLQQSVAAMQQAIQEGELGGDEAISGDLESAGKAAASGNKGAAKLVESAGERMGKNIRAGIKNGDFKAFEAALILAIVKDIIDFLDPTGAIPFIVNCVVTSTLAIILAGQNNAFIKWFVQKYLGPAIIGVIAEFIPGFDLIPTYTIGIISMKIACDKKHKRGEGVYEAIANQMANLKKGHVPNLSDE